MGSCVTERCTHFSAHKLKIIGTNHTQTILTGFDIGKYKILGLGVFAVAAAVKLPKSSLKQHTNQINLG